MMKSGSAMKRKTIERKADSLLGKFTTKRIGLLACLILLVAAVSVVWMLQGSNIAVLSPKGTIATQQLDLIVFTVALGMVVVVPVFILLFVFAFRYRESRSGSRYEPEQGGNTLLELVWWGIPIVIIGILSVVTWVSTHQLDPYRQLSSDKQPLRVQVVALQWKWLFLYPDQGVASVNELRIPEKTPVNFEVTADAPMSTFWIPQLGSQIYAMSGMRTKLSLEADKTGEYRGTNTNISGEGYAEMDFKVVASSSAEFDLWVKNLQGSSSHMTWAEYEKIAKPSRKQPVMYYMLHESDIYDKIIAKYMSHGSTGESYEESATMDNMKHGGTH
jgi:cytochrome o ubiquinol oxidase subunit 2